MSDRVAEVEAKLKKLRKKFLAVDSSERLLLEVVELLLAEVGAQRAELADFKGRLAALEHAVRRQQTQHTSLVGKPLDNRSPLIGTIHHNDKAKR